jgi:hypothetical protein
MVTEPAYRDPIRTIALHSPRQMKYLDAELRQRIGPDDIERFNIRVGMPPNFQGDQRNIILLSMVYDNPNGAMTARVHQRNYNVAVSRAEDQLLVFSSIPPTATFPDGDMRAALLSYLRHPPRPLAVDLSLDHAAANTLQAPFDSLLEQQIYLRLRRAGYAVVLHHPINDRHIDLLVVGDRGQLGVHCDTPQNDITLTDLHDEIRLHKVLTRAGWNIVHARESEYRFDPDAALAPLWKALTDRGIKPHELPAARSDGPGWSPPELSDMEDLG